MARQQVETRQTGGDLSGRMIAMAMPVVMVATRLVQRILCAFGYTFRTTQAIVLTPSGSVVLVAHRYRSGWHLPGGYLGRDESADLGIRRELREEIGLLEFESFEPIGNHDEIWRGVRQSVDLFIVTGARWQDSGSWEIREVRSFDPADFPADAPAAANRYRDALSDGHIAMHRSLGTVVKRAQFQ